MTRYARPMRAWGFHMGLPDATLLADLRRWKPHGIIATITEPRLEKRFLGLGVPLVNCSSNITTHVANRVITDNHAVGCLAVDHLLSHGYRHLAYVGEAQMPASEDRYKAFALHARMDVPKFVDSRTQSQVGEIGWHVTDHDHPLRQWLIDLPKPAGILACHDPMAMLLVEVCRQLHLDVPGQVGILGVDDDAMLCEMTYPTLSSVQMAHERIGFEAARRLDQLMDDRSSEPMVQLIGPVGVVTRQSTEAMATDDMIVSTVLRYIQEHADEPIRVSDVVEQTTISRRNLELRFEAAVGTSILNAIQKAHINLANELLASTNMTVEQIAMACGFNSRERFSAVYHQLTGATPGATRQQMML
jgi:LacI family transcriptional regulator